MKRFGNPWIVSAIMVILAGGAYLVWLYLKPARLPEGIAAGNGRIEAVEIDIAAKIPGRIKDILVDEGDLVRTGQVLAHMDTEQLEAQRREAQAQLEKANIAVQTAQSIVKQREAERTAAIAVVAQREADLDAAQRRLARSTELVPRGATPLRYKTANAKSRRFYAHSSDKGS